VTEVLRVKKPGLFTTVQDLGRPQAIASGVQPGGAMDRFAHSAANLLAGNEHSAATLECTLSGPHLVAERACLIAICGADFDPQVNGKPAPMWAGVFMRAGDELTFAGRRNGARAYIAVGGGVAADRWLGSLSTNVMAARGGMHGRALIGGDVIATEGDASGPAISGREVPEHLRPDYSDHTLHAIAGPHVGRLGAAGRRILFESTFRVSRDADRMGYRLEGKPLVPSGEELLSYGLTSGALQVPAGGQPILLMADHQTAGGYPAVATVVSASMPIAAQLVPGDELRFAEITVEGALRLRKARGDALASLRR
jgi:antagonist of KipI